MEERLPCKLVVVLHTDVGGYSSLMEQDEDLTHQRVKEAFDLLDEAICR